MKVALVLSILVLFIGLGYSFKLSDFFDEDTERQSEVEDQILPVFTIAFFASLFNSLFFGITNQNSGNSCECGVRRNGRSGNRIVGGEDAETGEFPWIVRIEIDGGPVIGFPQLEYCGGTLLSSDTVVTLAVCVGSRVPNAIGDWRVIVGDHDRSTSDGEQTIAAREIILHPDFDILNPAENNFAIIKLASPVTFSDRVAPICLPTATTNYDSVPATVAGWGWVSVAAGPAGVNSDILQKLDVRTMPNEQCSSAHPLNPFTPPGPTEMCTLQGGANPGTGDGENICLNDQGGPLITNEGRFFSIIGMAGTIGCNEPGTTARADKYARVTSGLTWINQQISGNTCPRPN